MNMEQNLSVGKLVTAILLITASFSFSSHSQASIISYSGTCIGNTDPTLDCQAIDLSDGDQITAEFGLSIEVTESTSYLDENHVSFWSVNAGNISFSSVDTTNWDLRATLSNGVFTSFQFLASLPTSIGQYFGKPTVDLRLNQWFVTPNGVCASPQSGQGPCDFNVSNSFLYFDQGPGNAIGSVTSIDVPEPAGLALMLLGLISLAKVRQKA